MGKTKLVITVLIITILFLSVIAGIIFYYSGVVNDKNSKIDSLNNEITNQNNEIANLTSQISNLTRQMANTTANTTNSYTIYYTEIGRSFTNNSTFLRLNVTIDYKGLVEIPEMTSFYITDKGVLVSHSAGSPTNYNNPINVFQLDFNINSIYTSNSYTLANDNLPVGTHWIKQ